MNIWQKSQRVSLRALFISVLLLSICSSTAINPVSAEKSLPKVGLVPDGPLDDNGYNQMAYEGLMRADTEGLVDGFVFEPATFDEPGYLAAIAQCVADGCSLCVTVGFMMGGLTLSAAVSAPGVNFAIIDMSWDEGTYPANLRGTYFSVDEAAYLAWTLASLMTESNQIGIVAGMDIPPVNDFVIPYTYGAQWANHQVNVMLTYANDFEDEALGEALAQAQIDSGADIIFGVAGMAGNGAIKKAASLSKYSIGVDADTYYTVFGGGTEAGSEYLLTSVLKRVDNAVYDIITAHVNGLFTSGTYTYDVGNDGVGLAPYHETQPVIPLEVISYLNTVTAGISNGSVDVWQAFYTDFIYLPTVLR